MLKHCLSIAIILLYISLFLTSTACTEEEHVPLTKPSEQIEFVFTQEEHTTRADIGANGEGTFQEGDKVGLYVYNSSTATVTSYYELILRNGHWTPAVNPQEWGKGSLSLYAFYPCNNVTQPTVAYHNHEVHSNQNSQASYEASDLLWGAETWYNNGETEIHIGFSHTMFRVNVDVQAFNNSVSKVEVRGMRKGSITFDTNSLFVDKESTLEWIEAYPWNGNTYSAILFPQTSGTINQYTPGDLQVRLTLTASGTPRTVVFDNIQASQLSEMKRGGEITITLKPKEEDPTDIDFAGKTYWVYGIQAPSYPGDDNVMYISPGTEDFEPGQWFKFKYSNESMHSPARLSWEEGCGWFDCNKGYHDDSNMCWAASSSNILHWWMNANQKYIAQYDALHPDLASKRPSPQISSEAPDKSEIFAFYSSYFINRAGGAYPGIIWLFNGNKGNLSPPFKNEALGRAFKGFFPDFDTSNLVKYAGGGLTKEKFNQLMKQAFSERYAIAFSINYSTTARELHEMTIWGAEFDEKGNVEYIYYTDNNIPNDYDIGNPLCIREKVEYNNGIAYLQGKFLISSTTIVHIGEEAWQKLLAQ